VALDRGQWRVLVKTVVNFRKGADFLDYVSDY
jgi:hypothetical protein